MSLGTLTNRPPPVPIVPGVCRVCGCTDAEACELWDRPPQPMTGEIQTCSWVEQDLCSRCHGPRRPTRGQAGELARIRSRLGRVHVARGPIPGSLRVTLAGPPPASSEMSSLGRLEAAIIAVKIERGEWWPGRTIVLDPHGHPYVRS